MLGARAANCIRKGSRGICSSSLPLQCVPTPRFRCCFIGACMHACANAFRSTERRRDDCLPSARDVEEFDGRRGPDKARDVFRTLGANAVALCVGCFVCSAGAQRGSRIQTRQIQRCDRSLAIQRIPQVHRASRTDIVPSAGIVHHRTRLEMSDDKQAR